MKKALKLLSLAMLFAMPLAACNPANGGNGGSGSGDSGGDGSGGGGGGSSLTAKGEATRIAAEMYGIDEDEVTFVDYEDEEAEGDIYKYESSKLSFYMTGYLDDSMSYDEMVSDIKSFMPSGAEKNSTYSYGKQDLSEDGITYIYFDEVYTKDGMAYNVIVDYYEDDEYGIDASASICVLKESQLAAYAEYFDSEGDDDWDDDDDWEDDDDDDEGGGSGSQQSGSVTLNFSNLKDIAGKVDGVSYEATKGTSSEAAIGNDNDLRIYAGGTFILSATSNMTKAVFEISTKGLYRLADISVNTGSISYSSDNKVVTWTGNANKVVFTVGEKATHGTDGSSKAGQFDFYSVVVTLGNGSSSGDEGGGGSGGGGSGSGGQVADAGEAFFKEVLEIVFGYEPEFDVDYWDDDGLFTILECDDLEDDIDEMYADLSQLYSCTEPEDDSGFYGFYLDSDDGNYYIDIYSGEDETDGNFIEMDLWEI